MQKYSVYRILNFKEMGIYYGCTKNFEQRKKDHQKNIKEKINLNDTFEAAVEKHHWTDFRIEEIEKFNCYIDAKLKEEELILKSKKNINHLLYNEKIPKKNAENIMMVIARELAEKFTEYKKNHNLNKSELTRMILEDYFAENTQKIIWSLEEIERAKKSYIGVRIKNHLLLQMRNFSHKYKIQKTLIYHSAMDLFFQKN
ncbi:GIY-YIG nuclease family protein [Halanaerobium sp. Z-7514]|uniref:GIY-YIG nuclease family protein n=1 Tax=Halanaerobium polyolivorans TaxID=2886943 RepID=A0AAW4X1W1_9FIRM|nr:GIY-YIG nuclease family protein [Halanaerobium polyolivorans]MCC3145768.1 GIY-YIG nuclease family protein [Halanaerobium polyolivorans]